MTARAHWLGAAARPHVDLNAEALRAKPRLLGDEARKVLTLIEKADQPHATKPQSKRHVAGHLTSTGIGVGCCGGGVPGCWKGRSTCERRDHLGSARTVKLCNLRPVLP